jgi:hypothetical protein
MGMRLLLTRGGGYTQAECVHALKGLALLRASPTESLRRDRPVGLTSPAFHRRLRQRQVLFAHTVVTVAKNRTSAIPSGYAPRTANVTVPQMGADEHTVTVS